MVLDSEIREFLKLTTLIKKSGLKLDEKTDILSFMYSGFVLQNRD